MKDKAKLVQLDGRLRNRSVNEGFSGGEKKRNEIFQMAMLEPKLAILDETDSGLDIDALRIVSEGVNATLVPGHHALPAFARLHRAGLRARARRWTHCPFWRQRIGVGAVRLNQRLNLSVQVHLGV